MKYNLFTRLQDENWQFDSSYDVLLTARAAAVRLINGPLGRSCMYEIIGSNNVCYYDNRSLLSFTDKEDIELTSKPKKSKKKVKKVKPIKDFGKFILDFYKKNKPKFEPHIFYDKDSDCIEVLFKECNYNINLIDRNIDILKDFETSEVVGFNIYGVKNIIKKGIVKINVS